MIWLSTPHFKTNELELISSKLADDNFLHSSDFTGKFEGQLNKLNGLYTACTNSGTSAIHLALMLLDVGTNDEVICADFSFAASAFPVLYQGARLNLIDCEESSWGIDPELLESCLSEHKKTGSLPKAIIAVHCYGMPYQVDRIAEIAMHYGVPIIEDAAEAVGSTFRGKRCGTFGSLSAYSFNLNKIITSCGGGAITSRIESQIKEAKRILNQSKIPGYHYKHDQLGYNYRINDLGAAIGYSQIQDLDEKVYLRRKINARYKDSFQDNALLSIFSEPDERYFSNHWLSCVLFDKGINHEKVIAHYLKYDIEVRPLWNPLHDQNVFKDCAYYGNAIAGSLFERGLCLPSSSSLSEIDQEKVIELTLSVAENLNNYT